MNVAHFVRVLLIVTIILAGHSPDAPAQTMVEHSAETRFMVDLRVPDAALAPFLPQGWTFNINQQGPSKDVNLRVVFIDRITINGADGKPVGKTGSNRLVHLAVPVRDAGGNAAQLLIGGLTEDPADTTGSGVYLPAATHTMTRSTSSGTGPILESQDWVFAATTGERLELHIKYERGVGNRGNASETRFYSANNPGAFQIHRQEQVVDILRNVATNPPDRVKEFSFNAGGGSFSKLFDGPQKILSWDNFVWATRTVLQP